MELREAIERVKENNFCSRPCVFDGQLLLDAFGTIAEAIKTGRLRGVITCDQCVYANPQRDPCYEKGTVYQCCSPFGNSSPRGYFHEGHWFCYDGIKRKDDKK